MVAAGDYHSLMITTKGEVWMWGDNSKCQLGAEQVCDRWTAICPSLVSTTGDIPNVILGADHVRETADLYRTRACRSVMVGTFFVPFCFILVCGLEALQQEFPVFEKT